MNLVEQLNDDPQPMARLLGLVFTVATPERIVAELAVRGELCTRGGTLHGGAVMAFADILGATGTMANLEPGQRTTTIESKTNFVAPAPEGARVVGESTPVHRGRRTMVWQTRISLPDGKLIALVTQTQIVL
ncbi:MAG: PaaI family thioesterase [Alphaproteobacteria bacterium]|nr:PaaI family thioesterase [Alphaproteobacteria bacterium]